MMSKSKKITLTSCIIGAFLLIAILGTIYDLQISKALASLKVGEYHSSNFFAIIGESFGENVLYIFLVCSCAILFFYLMKFPLKKKWLNITLMVTICVVSYLIGIYALNKTLNYIALYTNIGLENYLSSFIGYFTIFSITLVLNSIVFLLFTKLKPETLKYLWKWALIVIITSIISNGIVQISKRIFDRTRYRAMVFVGDDEFQHFTYWFQININKFNSISIYAEDFFKSFPSGHTCAAASIFLLTCLPYFLPKTNNKKYKTIFWSVAISYTFLIALSRIIAGAHFFMDVFIGATITIVTILLTNFIFIKYFNKNKNNIVYEKENNIENAVNVEDVKKIKNNESFKELNNEERLKKTNLKTKDLKTKEISKNVNKDTKIVSKDKTANKEVNKKTNKKENEKNNNNANRKQQKS